MGTPLVKNTVTPTTNTYGAGPWFQLNITLVGAGAGNAPTVGAVSGINPPGCEELSSNTAGLNQSSTPIVRNSAGNYTLTFADAYYAVISWNVSADDINGSTPIPAPQLGQFKNLGCNPTVGTPGTPMQCTLTTYNTSFSNADVANGTPIRLSITFKKDFTGAAA